MSKPVMELLQAMGSVTPPLEIAERAAARRARTIAHLIGVERQIRRDRRRTRRALVFAALCAAAGAVLVSVAFLRDAQPRLESSTLQARVIAGRVSVTHGSESSPHQPPDALA